ncbi:MAG: helix-turn-helix domain-containing protein [Gemmatimonadaceae bacterium]
MLAIAPAVLDRPVLLTLSADYTATERVRRGVQAQFALKRCVTVRQALDALAALRPAGVLLSATDGEGARTAPFVTQLRALCGEVPVIAMLHRAESLSPAALALIAVTPTVVVTVEDLDLASVARALVGRVWRTEFVAAVWPQLEVDVPRPLRPMLRYALARAGEPLRVQAIADALGVDRKTLWRRCRAHGMQNVRAVARWCRLLAAAHALRTRPGAVDAIAEELAFASPTAMRNAIRRYLGTTPTGLRASGGERLACAAFRRWMQQQAPPRAVTLRDLTCEGPRSCGDTMALA